MKKKLGLLILILISARLSESYSDSEESEESTTVASRTNSDSDSSKGYFTVTANRLLRLNKPFRVSVQFQGYKNEKILKVGIKNKKFEEFKEVTLHNSSSKTVEFVLKDQHSGDYKLEVKSVTGDNFESSRNIEIVKKKFSVFIQTDKSIYKPADKVQFRVLLLDGDTRPFNASKVKIFVTDGGDNRVKQFDNPQFVKGVYQNELQLSDLPVMGKWKVNVEVDGKRSEKKEFEVAEYVLPKFEFTINANPDANFKDGKIRATVKAKYTFGKTAKGNATITASRQAPTWSYYGNNNQKEVTKTVDIDGKKIVEFDIEKDLEIKDKHREYTIDLKATFTEELSGKEQNATAKVQIHITPHKMDFKKSGEKFKPGLPYKVTAIVKYHDKDAPVTDTQNTVKFTIRNYKTIKSKCTRYPFGGFGWNTPVSSRTFENSYPWDLRYTTTTPRIEEYDCDKETSTTEEKSVYPKNGKAEVEIDIDSNVERFNVEAKYLDTVKSISNVPKAESKSNEFLQIKSLTKDPKLNNPIQIEVHGTKAMKQFSYQVIGIGSVIESKTLSVPNLKKTEFSFTATDEMAPSSHIIVYYLTSDGEIISDKLKIELESDLKNPIDIQLSQNQLKPSEALDIKVKTTKDSFVGLLGVDQSVLVLKKGNDIEKSKVTEELKEFSKGTDSYENRDIYRDFKDSDVLIMTNAISEYKKPYNPPHYGWNSYPSFPGSYGFRSGPSYAYSGLTGNSFGGGFGGGFSGFGGSAANAAASAQSFNSAYQPQSIPSFSPQATSLSLDSGNKNYEEKTQLKPKKENKPVEVRTEFPETWLFESFNLDSNETSKVLSIKAPDTIISWIITGFSVNPTYGLGLTREASTLNVFQPFFVSTNLPYSIKRGEVVAIPFTVFNYMQNDQEVEVKFFNADREFEFVEVNEEENEVKNKRKKRGVELERVKKVFVKSNEGATVKFMIRSLKAGYITIKVTAESQIAGDGVEQKLLVVPEGVTQYMNEAVLIDLRNSSEFKTSINIKVPNNTVEDSTRIEAAVSGDLLGPSIENLDKLIKLPYGCGEQNMVNFVPNIVVLDYLTSVNKLTPEIEKKAKEHMESGYQRELGYKHNDGSYSAFGKSDSSGSTWLTAFVIKSFNQASKYIEIETDVMNDGLKFLSKTQKRDGSFPEVGYVLSSSLQGGSSKGIGLTAYVLTTFLEANSADKYKDVVRKGLGYILDNIEELNDNYSLAIASYALQLAKDSFYDNIRNTLLEKLEGKAENQGQMKYWKRESAKKSSRPNSVNIEMTSYALLAYLEAGRYADGFSIGKWLVTQRNENGGFQSTQDTVVGLQALAKLASKGSGVQNDIKINIKTDEKSLNMDVNSDNSLILQKFELPSNSRNFEITANGQGSCLLQISHRYNIDTKKKRPRFTLQPKVGSASHKEYLHLTVCTKFVPDEYATKSNMAVMEVTLPSGFTFDTDHMKDLKSTRRVKKVETQDSDTIVIVYFDDIDANEICPEFKAYRTHGVAKQKPSPIIVYDYYDNSRHAREFYNSPEVSLCDICGDEDECQSACETSDIEIMT